MQQLARAARAARQGDASPGRLTIGDFVRVAGQVKDPKVPIEVGKAADLVVFDANRPHLRPHVNPLGNLVHTGQGRDVRMVLVAGDVLVEDGRPTRVDMDAVCAEAESAARELWSAEGKPYWR